MGKAVSPAERLRRESLPQTFNRRSEVVDALQKMKDVLCEIEDHVHNGVEWAASVIGGLMSSDAYDWNSLHAAFGGEQLCRLLKASEHGEHSTDLDACLRMFQSVLDGYEKEYGQDQVYEEACERVSVFPAYS